MLQRYRDRHDLLDDLRFLFDDRTLLRESVDYTVSKKDDHLEISLDLPGVKLEDLELSFDKNVINVRGRRDNREVKRSIVVDSSYDLSTATGNLKDGVLTVRVKRSKVVSRLIPVS